MNFLKKYFPAFFNFGNSSSLLLKKAGEEIKNEPQKIFHCLLIFILFLIPYTVIYVDEGLIFPFITGKVFVFLILSEVAFLIWISLAILNKKFRITKSALLTTLILYFLIIFISNIFGQDPYSAFWSNPERMNGFIFYIHYLLYFITLLGTFKNKQIWIYFLNNLIVTGLFTAYYALGQDKERVDSVFGNPIYLAIYLVFQLFLSTFLLLREWTKKNKKVLWKIVFYLFSLSLFFWIFLQTNSRGATLGLILGTISSLSLYAFLEKEKKILRYTLLSLSILIFSLWTLFFIFKEDLAKTNFIQNTFLLERLTNISMEDTSVSHRLAGWKIAVQGWQERPLLGWGGEGYPYAFTKYYDNETIKIPKIWFNEPHNIFLEKLFSYGIIGLILYLFIFLYAFKALLERKGFNNKDKSIFFGMLIAYGISLATIFDAHPTNLFFFSILAFLVFKKNKKKNSKNNKNLTKFSFLIPIFTIFVIFSVYYFSVKPYILITKFKTNYQSLQAVGLISYCSKNLKPPEEKIKIKTFNNYCKEMNKYNYKKDEALTPYINNLKNIFEENTFINNDLLLAIYWTKLPLFFESKKENIRDYFSLIALNFEKKLNRSPDDARFRYAYADFLFRIGLFKEAEKELQQALDYSPKKQDFLILKEKISLKKESLK